LSWRTIYRAQEEARKKGTAPPKPVPAAKTSEEPRPRVVAEKPPAELGTLARQLWYAEREIQACSNAIAQAHANGDGVRTASLQDQLRKWLKTLAELQPVVLDKAEEERRWRAQADSVLAKIRQGMKAAAPKVAA
jgi:hypothetical protein